MITNRLHFMDLARSAILLLGIPYHAAMFYVSGETWLINSFKRSEILTLFVDFMRVFHMPFFFFLAGYFSFVSLSRGNSGWINSRIYRVGIPLATGLVTLSPVQIWVQLSVGTYTGEWLYHLWFLLVLIIYSVAYAAFLHKYLSKCVPNMEKFLILAITLTASLNALVYLTVGGMAQFMDLSVFHLPIRQTLQYLPAFAVGAAIAANPALQEKATTAPTFFIVCSFASLFALVAFQAYGTNYIPPIVCSALIEGTKGMISIPIIISIISICRRHLNSKNRFVEELSNKSLMIYLFHHPLVLLSALALTHTLIDPAVGFVAICIFVALSSYALSWLVSKSRRLYFLFNGFTPNLRAK